MIATIAAVVVHLIIGALIFLNVFFDEESTLTHNAPEVDTIIATTVSAEELQSQKQRIIEASKKRELEEQQRVQKEEQKLEDIRQQQEIETKRLEAQK